MEHGECPHCSAALSIPCISIVDNLRKLSSLLDGSQNIATCHGCGEPTPISPHSGPAQWLFQGPSAESKFQPVGLLSPHPQHMRPRVVAVLLHHRAQPLRVLAQCRQHLRLDP